LLRRGAGCVYAVDVGHDQLHATLRRDDRVIVREGINARDLSPEVVPEPVDLIVADVSFISLKLVLPPALALAAPKALLVALIKPQFEAGRDRVKKGVVRDENVQREVCDEIATFAAAQPGWKVTGIEPSPVIGPEGNKEFLIVARKG
jgi:23S rRNA (cytidine1920-2'-O)/16S rRNA (cytidine1409-2'-O)-methyltransferase